MTPGCHNVNLDPSVKKEKNHFPITAYKTRSNEAVYKMLQRNKLFPIPQGDLP